jgi:serine/threonine protein kinase
VIGKLIRHYRIEEVVGQGGMGVVYRALDTNLERPVAVKVLSKLYRGDPEFVDRFRQEVRIQAGLNHPNIATLFDFFVWNDMPVAVMEFIKGETLRSMVDRCGPIPAHIALPIFTQALQGVAAGHKRRIIHRDLKPSNLMVTDEGIVKVTDFGIAKVRSTTGLTHESTRVGSASYMAPEQILGRPVDVQTDIYIMGGTLYELLSGRPPFQGISQFEIDSAHVRDPPKAPTAYCPDIPPAAVDAIMRALAKEPSQRFASAEEFIQALPDLRGVPYIAVDAAKPVSSVGGSEDETRRQQTPPKVAPLRWAAVTEGGARARQNTPNMASVPGDGMGSEDETRVPHKAGARAEQSTPDPASAVPASTVSDDETRARQSAANPASALRSGRDSAGAVRIPQNASGPVSGPSVDVPSDDETRLQESAPKIAIGPRPDAPAGDETRPGQNLPNITGASRASAIRDDETRLLPSASKGTSRRRTGTPIAIGSVLALSIAIIVRYTIRHSGVDSDPIPQSSSARTERSAQAAQTQHPASSGTVDTPSNTEGSAVPTPTLPSNTADTASPTTPSPGTALSAPPNTPPNTAPTTPPNTAATEQLTPTPKVIEPATPAPSPPIKDNRGLTGTWNAAYLDRSGKTLLQLENLQIQQVADGAITGHFTYQATGSAGEECTLDKSSYSTQNKRLRLIVHCRNPDHPKYLNVPLEFADVDPGAPSIEGGRLASHLADDIVVTLKRAKGI